MQNYFKFYLVWSVFSILLLIGGFGWQAIKSGNLQQQLETTKKDHAALTEKLDALDTTLEARTGELAAAQEEIQKVQETTETLQQRNDELRKQISVRDAEIDRLKGVAKTLRSEKTEQKSQPMPSRGTPDTGRTIVVEATAYTAYCPGCSGLTKWKELDLRKNPHLKVIAVDPNVIPLGSKVYVEGYGYAVAADIGGGIDGHEIDIFMPNHSDAVAWGRKTITVKVLGS